MRTGKTLEQLGKEVMRQREARKDYIANVKAISAAHFSDPAAAPNDPPNPGVEFQGVNLILSNGNRREFPVNDYAHGQIATYTGIPKQFYDRLRGTHAALLANTVNTLMSEKPADKRLVRTLDGRCRAFLSDRYRCLDNIDLMEHLMPMIMPRRDLSLAASEITEQRLYIKLVSSELQGEVKVNDVVRMGLLISNSEVGAGSIMVAPFTERLRCRNGAVHLEYGKRKAHLGRAFDGLNDEVTELFTDETKKAADKAFFLQLRDVVSNILTGDTLKGLLEDMKAAAEDKPEFRDVASEVEEITMGLGLNKFERSTALKMLIEGGDLSRWGIANSITATAGEVNDFDRATELEAIGASVMSNPIIRTSARRVQRREPVMA